MWNSPVPRASARRAIAVSAVIAGMALLSVGSFAEREKAHAQTGPQQFFQTPWDKIPNPCFSGVTKTALGGNWSLASSWNPSGAPGAMDGVLVPAGVTVTFDAANGSARDLCIEGTVNFRTDIATKLTARNVFVYPIGTLTVGTATSPVAANVTAEIVIANTPLETGTVASPGRDPAQYLNGLVGLGKVTMHGAVKTPTFVRVAAEPRAGQNTIQLSQAVSGWRVGDKFVLPDSRQVPTDDGSGNRDSTAQLEVRSVQSVNGTTVTFTPALQFDHRGTTDEDGNGQPDYLPHVGNITRNILIRSESRTGTRGHVFFTYRATVDIRYASFEGLGRTTFNDLSSTTFNAQGAVTSIGTNQIGRYSLHAHHLMGPNPTVDPQYQFRLVGNSMYEDAANTPPQKWAITLHDSHYGLVQDNVMYNVGGASLVTEDGSESFNVIDHNFAVRTKSNGGRAEFDADPNGRGIAREGVGFWFRGPNNYIRNNVAANHGEETSDVEASYGFKYGMVYLGNVKIPNFRGADTSVSGQYTTRDGNAMPLLEFTGNEMYGVIQGLTIWWLCSIDFGAQNCPQSYLRDTVIWHASRYAYYGYPAANYTFDNVKVYGDPAALNTCCEFKSHFWYGDYGTKNHTVRNSSFYNTGGWTGPYFRDGSIRIENSFLKTLDGIVHLKSGAPGSCPSCDLPDPDVIAVSNRFAAPAGFPLRTISLGDGDVTDPANKDRLFVCNHGGVAGDNFEVFFRNYGSTPCTTTRPDISNAYVCVTPAVATACGGTSDTTPPSAPSNLQATGGIGQASLTWTAATDNVGVFRYNIHRSTTSGFTPSASNRIGQPTGTSYSDVGLSAGTYRYKVTAEDASGNIGAASNQASATVTGDTTNPTVSITAPANGASVAGTITVSANASDNVGVVGVTFRVDGNPIASEDTTAPYAISWDTSSVSNGSHAVTAVARDAAGNSRTSSTVTVTVTTPPVAAAYCFEEGTGLTVDDKSPNNYDGSISGATWTAQGKNGNALSFDGLNDKVSLGTALNVLPPFTISTWIYPTSRSDWRAIISKRDSPAANDMRFDLGLEVTTGNVYLYTGTLVASSYAPPLNTWTHLAVVVNASGTASLYANDTLQGMFGPIALGSDTTAKVTIGNTGDDDDPFAGTIDDLRVYGRTLTQSEIQTDMNTPVCVGAANQPPVINSFTATATDRSTTAGMQVYRNDLITLAGNVTDPESTPVWTLFSKLGANPGQPIGAQGRPGPNVSDSFAIPAGAATNGSYTFTLQASDGTSTVSQVSQAFTVIDQPDSTPPTVSITAPTNGSTVSSTINVNANVSDNVGVTGVQFKLDGQNLGVEDTSSPYSVSWDTTTATNGSHALTAVARDAAGNATTSAAVTVTVSNATGETMLLNFDNWGNTVHDLSWLTLQSGGDHVVVFAKSDSGDDQLSLAPGAGPDGSTALLITSINATAGLPGFWVGKFRATGGSYDNIYDNGIYMLQPPGTCGNRLAFDMKFEDGYLAARADDQPPEYPNSDIFQVGTYQGINEPESNNWHFYYQMWPRHDQATAATTAAGKWFHVVLNEAPQHQRSLNAQPPLNPTQPVGDFWELLTRFYMEATSYFGNPEKPYPVKMWVDNIKFLCVTEPNDVTVDITGIATGQNVIVSKNVARDFPVTVRNNTQTFITGFMDYAGPNWYNPELRTTGGADAIGPITLLPGETRSLILRVTPDNSLNTGDADWVGLSFVDQRDIDSGATYARRSKSDLKIERRWGSETGGFDSVIKGDFVYPEIGSDPTPPTVSLTAPAAGATVSNTVTISANATDNVGVAGVQFKLDGVNLGAEDTTSPYSVSWNTTTTTNGSHALTAVARDAAGNSTTSNPVSVTVSNANQPPVINSFTATATDRSTAAGIQVYRNDLVTLTGNVTDPETTPVWSLFSKWNTDPGQPIGAQGRPGPTVSDTFIVPGSAASGGAYTFTLQASDGTSTVSQVSQSFTVIDQTDSTPPTVSITAPANGATVSATVTVSANASDNVGVAGVQFKLNGVNLGAEDTTSPYSISWVTTTATNGSHSLTAVARDAAGNSTTANAVTVTVSNATAGPARIILNEYDGTTVPTNKDGDGYPYQYTGEGGQGTMSINTTDAVSGNSVQLRLTTGLAYAQWNPWGYNVGVGREFARTYETDPNASWQFNTYNRMRFWYKRPISASPHATDGTANAQFGTYTKCIAKPGCPDSTTDEDPNQHWYHFMNAPNWGVWTQVIMDMHPNHQRGGNGGTEWGVQLHPTGENAYNYFDTLTRFYVNEIAGASQYPADYRIDNIEFYRETNVENEDQVYSIAATYRPSDNRLLVTWYRNKDENTINHEVRYAFSDIHASGWNAATPAPNGVITPPGWQGYNGMVYDTTALPLAGKTEVYIAVKPQNSSPFKQIRVPLNVGTSGDTTPPTVAITAPAANTTVADTVTFSANASDNVGVTQVEFLVDGTVRGTDTTSPYSVNWDTTNGGTHACSGPHTHSLTAKAFDAAGNSSTSSAVTVNMNNPAYCPPPNSSPTVSAGADQTITLPATASLNGSVTDDNLPNPPAATTKQWSKVSGPGTVTFSAPTASITTATFSLAGTYVLRLTANDSLLSASDDVQVTASAANLPPVVTSFTGNPVAPAVDRDLGTPGLQVYEGDSVDYVASGTDPNNDPLTHALWYGIGSAPGTQYGTGNGNTFSYRFTYPAGSAGTTYRWTAIFQDPLGATGQQTLNVSVIPRPNSAPTVSAGPDLSLILPSQALLDGTVSDDGLPNPPGTLAIAWMKVSGPGNVTFGNASLADTTATFSTAGTYVLRLSASDNALNALDDVIVIVSSVPNQPPTVSAGADQTITLPSSASLDGTVSDDGLPTGKVTTTWALVSGPGTVTFGDETAVDTTATFSTAGTYVLKLSGDDGMTSAADNVTITVQPGNAAPLVSAGRDATITLPAFVSLDGMVSDDGLPVPPGTLTTTWSRVNGPGTVTFGNATAVDTTASFSTAGTYDLRLTASDSVLTTTDDVQVIVLPALPVNQAPTVNAGVDLTITLPVGASLIGTVVDDGLPSPPGATTKQWSKVNGPGTVTFSSATALSTTATFSTAGTYVLRLTASDSTLSGSDDVTVGVAPLPPPPPDTQPPSVAITAPANNATVQGAVTVSATAQDNVGVVGVQFSMDGAPLGTEDTSAPYSTPWNTLNAADGLHSLKASARDAAGNSTAAQISVTVQNAQPNQPPSVNAGADQTLSLPSSAGLDGTVSDDGLPVPPESITTTWSMVSGPGTVTFGNADAVDTTASFSAVGTYILRLSASDSALSAGDEVTVTVSAPLPSVPCIQIRFEGLRSPQQSVPMNIVIKNAAGTAIFTKDAPTSDEKALLSNLPTLVSTDLYQVELRAPGFLPVLATVSGSDLRNPNCFVLSSSLQIGDLDGDGIVSRQDIVDFIHHLRGTLHPVLTQIFGSARPPFSALVSAIRNYVQTRQGP